MSESEPTVTPAPDPRWYAVQTLSNMEGKVKAYLEKFVQIEEMGDYLLEVLMPLEKVVEKKNGRTYKRDRKFYPGYVFLKMRLYDTNGKLLQAPWYFVRNVQGVIGFIGGDRPVALKPDEIERIQMQIKAAEGREVPKVQYEVGQDVKINDGPFLNLVGRVDEIDEKNQKLKVSVSIFGRFTPVELEYHQVERVDDTQAAS